MIQVLAWLPLSAQTEVPLLNEQTGTKARTEALLTKSYKYWTNRSDSALILSKQALDLAQTLDDAALLAKAQRYVATGYWYRGKYDSALVNALNAEEIAKNNNLINERASILNLMGLIYSNRGDDELALVPYAEALEIKEKLLKNAAPNEVVAMEHNLSNSLANIATLYYKLESYDTALALHERVLNIRRRHKDTLSMCSSLQNIGYVYNDMQQHAVAAGHFRQLMKLAQAINSQRYMASGAAGYGSALMSLGKYDSSIYYQQTALGLHKKNNHTLGQSKSYIYLAWAYLNTARYNTSIDYLDSAKAILEKSRNRNNIIELYQIYALAYQGNEDYKAALKSSSIYHNYKDSIYSQSTARRLYDVTLRRQIKKSQEALQAKDRLISRSRQVTWFMGAILMLLLVLAGLVYNRYLIKRRTGNELQARHLEIQDQKREIEKQRQNLETQNTELAGAKETIKTKNLELAAINSQLEIKVRQRTWEIAQTNEKLLQALHDLDRFIYKMSHDIRGPLVRMLGLTQLGLKDVEEGEAREYLLMLEDTANQMNDKLGRLLLINQINHKELAAEKFALLPMVQEIVQRCASIDGYEHVEIQLKVEEGVTLNTDPYLLNIVLQNLIENAIKYRNTSHTAESFMRVSCQRQDDHTYIDVADNGIGISQEQVEKLFEMFSRAVDYQKGAGLGLYIAKMIMEKLGGKIQLYENRKRYTQFRLELPHTPPTNTTLTSSNAPGTHRMGA